MQPPVGCIYDSLGPVMTAHGVACNKCQISRWNGTTCVQVDAVLKYFEELRAQHREVSNKSRTLTDSCERLVCLSGITTEKYSWTLQLFLPNRSCTALCGHAHLRLVCGR